MSLIHTEDVNSPRDFYNRIKDNMLHLDSGLLLPRVKLCIGSGRVKFKGYMTWAEGMWAAAGCIIRWPDEAHYKLMLYVNPNVRKLGLGKTIVGRLMRSADDSYVHCFPWSRESIMFYRKCIIAGILTEDNFPPFELRLINEANLFYRTPPRIIRGNSEGIEEQRV